MRDHWSRRLTRLTSAVLLASVSAGWYAAESNPVERGWLDTVVAHGVLKGSIASLYLDHGLLFARTVQPHATDPHVMIFNRAGQAISTVKLDFPGSTEIRTYDAAAVGSDGSAVVSAAVWEQSHEVAAVLCFTVASGTIRRVVRTNPFLANVMRVAPDGNIWALGTDLERGHGARDALVLAKFSPEGRLLGQYLPRAAFGGSVHPSSISNRGRPYLLILSDRVGIWTSQTQEWWEVDFHGEVLGRWPAATIPQGGAAASLQDDSRMTVHSLAVTPTGRLLAWLTGFGRSGLYEFRKDQGSWLRLGRPFEPDARSYTGALGAEGERILMRTATPGEAAFRLVDLTHFAP